MLEFNITILQTNSPPSYLAEMTASADSFTVADGTCGTGCLPFFSPLTLGALQIAIIERRNLSHAIEHELLLVGTFIDS